MSDLVSTLGETAALATTAGVVQTWLAPALLGLGLASATGLRTFLPLLLLALAARFGWFGIELNDPMRWLEGTPAITALGVAAALEFAGDKVPVIDNSLNAVGAVTRPLAGAIAAGSVFVGVDPMLAAVAGIIVGAPTAFALNAAQGGTRLASTATTAGLGNPILSLIDDGVSLVLVLVAFIVPILAPVLLILLMVLAFRLARRLRDRLQPPAAGA